jgi:hypothetical protein
MDLTLAEIEQLAGVSRYQISRYAKDGRLERTRQGHYSAVSLANLHAPFNRREHTEKDINEERAVWLVRAEYHFRRELHRVIKSRSRRKTQNYGRQELTAKEQDEIEADVKAYVVALAAVPEK